MGAHAASVKVRCWHKADLNHKKSMHPFTSKYYRASRDMDDDGNFSPMETWQSLVQFEDEEDGSKT